MRVILQRVGRAFIIRKNMACRGIKKISFQLPCSGATSGRYVAVRFDPRSFKNSIRIP